MLALEPGALAEIREHAAASYPEECCGALVGRAGRDVRVVTDAWPIVNRSESASRHFVVGPDDYRRVEAGAAARGLALLGFYHSHPDAAAEPSRYDLSQAWPGFDYIIVAVARAVPGRLTAWRLRDDRSAFDSEEMTWPTES